MNMSKEESQDKLVKHDKLGGVCSCGHLSSYHAFTIPHPCRLKSELCECIKYDFFHAEICRITSNGGVDDNP